jgi:hypothetical protein
VEPEGSLPCSQKSATGPYPEPGESCSPINPNLPKVQLNVIVLPTPRSSQWSLPFGLPNILHFIFSLSTASTEIKSCREGPFIFLIMKSERMASLMTSISLSLVHSTITMEKCWTIKQSQFQSISKEMKTIHNHLFITKNSANGICQTDRGVSVNLSVKYISSALHMCSDIGIMTVAFRGLPLTLQENIHFHHGCFSPCFFHFTKYALYFRP